MRFTPSTNWDIVASSAFRQVVWKIERKHTTDISEALSAGTWVDITSFLDSFPGCSQAIEFSVGQFSSNSITLTASRGMFSGGVIQWMKDNVFNASASQYIELKVSATLKSGSITTSDTFYAFSGFVDKIEVIYNEVEDTVTFSVFTADELGNRISALSLNTQYINPDVDGSNTNGIILPVIPGIYVIDADVASYQLKSGLHTVEYDYNSGTEQMRLDNGDWVTLRGTDGTDTLISEDGLEKITIYVDVSDLINTGTVLTDYLIVKTPGDTLCAQPVYEQSLRRYLTTILSKVGITDITYDSLVLNTALGGKKISYYDVPPNDPTVIGKHHTIAHDGTDFYMCIANKLYKRTTSTGEYTLLATITGSGSTILVDKMFFNSRNNDLWMVYRNIGTGYCARRYDISGNSLSSEVLLSATASDINLYGIILIDYNYTGSSYKYGLIMNFVSSAAIKFLDDATMTLSTVITMSKSSSNGNFLFEHSSGLWKSLVFNSPSNYFNEITINSSGTWVDNGLGAVSQPPFSMGCYNADEDSLYYFNTAPDPDEFCSAKLDGTASTTILVSADTSPGVRAIICGSDNKVYFTVNDRYSPYLPGTLYQASNDAIDDSIACYAANYSSLIYTDRLYGVNCYGKLFQWHTQINMYLKQVLPTGSIRDLLVQAFQAYNLIGIISSNKKEFIYRRGNDSGTIQTTGNNITLNITNTSSIVQVQKAFRKINWVSVSNGTVTYTYDGSTYQAGTLDIADTLSISNDLIPDEIVQDLAKYLYTFFNTEHDKYTFKVDAALMQYEVMDGASVTFSTTKIAKTATGLITGQVINPDGSMEIEVLF